MAPEVAAIVERIIASRKWKTATRFKVALGSLPPDQQRAAALRVLRISPQSVEMAEKLTKPPAFPEADKAAAAQWIIEQCCLRAYRGKYASHRLITHDEALTAAGEVPVKDLPDLMDAALAIRQSEPYREGTLRNAVLRMARVSTARRRRIARAWRETGEATPSKHGASPSKNIRVSLDEMLDAGHPIGVGFQANIYGKAEETYHAVIRRRNRKAVDQPIEERDLSSLELRYLADGKEAETNQWAQPRVLSMVKNRQAVDATILRLRREAKDLRRLADEKDAAEESG